MKKGSGRRGGLGIVLLALLALLIGYLIWENSGFSVTDYTYQTRSVPDELDGMKILLLTDLHNKEFGENNEALLDAIREDSSRGEELLDLFMITKYYERIGDHATNIAEWVEYAITGERSEEN